ncbi:MAG: hypothetical protein M3Q65_10065 [Chloroflexota bacterium]|nr:hypothetical protein [Chloroflexota bacterium]
MFGRASRRSAVDIDAALRARAAALDAYARSPTGTAEAYRQGKPIALLDSPGLVARVKGKRQIVISGGGRRYAILHQARFTTGGTHWQLVNLSREADVLVRSRGVPFPEPTYQEELVAVKPGESLPLHDDDRVILSGEAWELALGYAEDRAEPVIRLQPVAGAEGMPGPATDGL